MDHRRVPPGRTHVPLPAVHGGGAAEGAGRGASQKSQVRQQPGRRLLFLRHGGLPLPSPRRDSLPRPSQTSRRRATEPRQLKVTKGKTYSNLYSTHISNSPIISPHPDRPRGPFFLPVRSPVFREAPERALRRRQIQGRGQGGRGRAIRERGLQAG